MRSSVKTLCGLCWVRFECDRYCPATWSSRFSIRCTYFCLGSFHRKDSWRERRPQHARRRKSIASDAALAGRSQLSVCCHSASFKKCARNCPDCPRVDDVRKCLLICSGQEQANTTTIECVCGPSRGFRSVRFASWFHESLMFSDHLHRAADARFEAVKNQLASLDRDLMHGTQEVWTFINVCAQYFYV